MCSPRRGHSREGGRGKTEGPRSSPGGGGWDWRGPGAGHRPISEMDASSWTLRAAGATAFAGRVEYRRMPGMLPTPGATPAATAPGTGGGPAQEERSTEPSWRTPDGRRTRPEETRGRSRSARRALRPGAPERRAYTRGRLPDLSAPASRAAALADFHGDVYAGTSRESNAFKLRTILRVFADWGTEPYPPSVDKVALLGATLKAGGTGRLRDTYPSTAPPVPGKATGLAQSSRWRPGTQHGRVPGAWGHRSEPRR